MGDKAGVMTDALTWAGTFHGIGARLLREYAEQIGLNPAFTIHDREDSAERGMTDAAPVLSESAVQSLFNDAIYPRIGTFLAFGTRFTPLA
jgi:UvrD/REP helicase N-terminal domain